MPRLVTRENSVVAADDLYGQGALDLEGFSGRRRSTGNSIIQPQTSKASFFLRTVCGFLALGCAAWSIYSLVQHERNVQNITASTLLFVMCVPLFGMVSRSAYEVHIWSEMLLAGSFLPDLLLSLFAWWNTYDYWAFQLPLYSFWTEMYRYFQEDFKLALDHYQLPISFIVISILSKLVALWAIMSVKYKYSSSRLGKFIHVLLAALLLGGASAVEFGFIVPLIAKDFPNVFTLQTIIGWVGVVCSLLALFAFVIGSGKGWMIVHLITFLGVAVFVGLMSVSLMTNGLKFNITKAIPSSFKLYFVIVMSVLLGGTLVALFGAVIGFPKHSRF